MKHYKRLAAIAQTLAHPVRLQILEALSIQPACVCDLVALTMHRQPYISQQLAVLRRAGWVEAERVGMQVRYRLARSELEDSLKILHSIGYSSSKFSVIHKTHQGERIGDNKSRSWYGISRTEINWHPIIGPDRCIGCGLCVTSCGQGVYAFDYAKNRPVVVAPEMCMVGCTTCATTCPEDAIDFPPIGCLRQLIKQRKVLDQSKNMLCTNREQYDVTLSHEIAG